MVGLLLDNGAQIDLQDNDGKSSLIHATCMGHRDLIAYLIEQDAQVNLQENNGWFPLMHAVKAGDLETVQILIAHGTSIHLKNIDGETVFDICPRELLKLPPFKELVRSLWHSLQNVMLYFNCAAPNIHY